MANGKKWAKDCVDAFEQIGRRQLFGNLRFLENYQMVNGKFIPHHYYEEEGYKDMISLLSQEFEIPSTLRHYDIIGKVVNNLTEKLSEFPDVFRVEEKYEEDETNEYVRAQTDLMHQSIKADIYNEIKSRLMAQGIDPEKNDFESEEEAMQYHEEMQKMEQAMTPSQINKYMKTDWQGQGEIWGQHQIEVDKERFNLPEMERVEFRDMLFTDRCFRHFYLTADGYDQESWNPINTFIHESPEVPWADDGDYVGRMFYFTKSQIIDRYGWKMKSKDIQALEDLEEETAGGAVDMQGFPYKVYAPFADFKAYELTKKHTGYDPINNLPTMGDDMLSALTTGSPLVDRNTGLFRVTEVYWMSQQQMRKVVYRDPATGQLVKDIVDETFVIPDGFKVVKGDFWNGDKENTVYTMWINQVWKGVKICFALNDSDAIYLDLGPNEFQFKGDYSVLGAKLPVTGRIFNNRNAQSMSLVDLMKPHQIGYNVCMNQLYQFMEKEIGKFMIWDARFFNTMKDWAGEDSWDKVAMVAKELGHVFGDTSPQNMPGGGGGQLPREVNLELTAQMFSRAKLAEFFESRCMSQLGISQQLMADVKATETATGINTAVSQASLNVQRFFTDFMQYKKRCLSMNLDIAQYVQSHNRDITIMYTKSDASRVFIKMVGTNLLLRNLHIYVVNSQQLLKQLEMIKQMFVQNNTTDASALDLVEVITANSPSAIKAKLKEVMDKKQAREDQMMQMQQQQIQQTGEMAKMKEEGEDRRNTEDNQTKIKVAEIDANAKIQSRPSFNNQPDNSGMEYNKFVAGQQQNDQTNEIAREGNSLKRQKQTTDNANKRKELQLKEKDLNLKKDKIKADRFTAVKNKNRYDK